MLSKVGAPVLDIEHHRLVDPQPCAAPQRGRKIIAGSGQVLPCLGQGITPLGEESLNLRVARRDPGSGRRGAGRTIEFVDRLRDHITGQSLDVALISGDQEVEEPGQRAGLAFPSAPRLLPFVSQMGQEPVGIRRRGRPKRLSQETGELEDHRTLGPDELVSDAGANLGKRKLICKFLLKVLLVLGRTQSPAESDGSDGSKHHHASLGSTILRTDHEYHESFTNHENMSNIHTKPGTGEIGEYPRGTRPSVLLHELTGFGIAEAMDTQPKRPSQDEAQAREDATGQGAAPRMGCRDRVKALNEAAAEAGDSGHADDDPWFGKNAAGAGSGRPAPTAEPTF